MFGKNHRAKLAAFAALIALGFIVFQGTSEAHHPEISARAVCIPANTARITLDVVAWENDDPNRRFNSDIHVTIAGETLYGAFTPANSYSFTVTFDVPADGATYTATASAKVPWGPNREFESPDNYRQVSVTVPERCPSGQTATTTIPPTTTVGPTTTTSTTSPTTTVEATVGVEGIVQTAPPTSVVVAAVQGVTLARTGTTPRRS